MSLVHVPPPGDPHHLCLGRTSVINRELLSGRAPESLAPEHQLFWDDKRARRFSLELFKDSRDTLSLKRS